MISYKLTQAKADGNIERDMLQFIRENGFRIYSDNDEMFSFPWRGKTIYCYSSATIYFSSLIEFAGFIELVGACIVSDNSITIYDGYIE